MTEIPKADQIYRHFKGNLYRIVTLAVHSETGEKMVVYQALYGDYTVYVRELSMFAGSVDRKKYPEAEQEERFKLVTELVGQGQGASIQVRTCPDEPIQIQAGTDERMAGKTEEETAQTEQAEPVLAGQVQTGQEGTEAARCKSEETKPVHRKPEEVRTARGESEVSEPVHEEQKETAPEQTKAGAKESGRADGEDEKPGEPEQQAADKREDSPLDPFLLDFLDADTYRERLNLLAALHVRLTDEMVNTMAVSLDVEIQEGDIEERYEALKNCLLTLEKYECNRVR